MKSSDGFNTPTLRECGYAFLIFADDGKDEKEIFRILKQLGLEWIDNEEQQGEV